MKNSIYQHSKHLLLTFFAILFLINVNAQTNKSLSYSIAKYDGGVINTTLNKTGKMMFEIKTISLAGVVTAYFVASQGLSGDGELQGRINSNGDLILAGPVANYDMRIAAKTDGKSIWANYSLSKPGDVQHGTFDVKLKDPAATPNTTDNSNTKVANPNCSFDKYPEVNSSTKFSEAVVKSIIYNSHAYEVETGGLSSPLAVGVQFLNITYDPTFINTVTTVPGKGAQRRNDAAPVNAKIYTTHVSYIVCKKFRDVITRTLFETGYIFFINKDGGWVGGVNGGAPKITYLK